MDVYLASGNAHKLEEFQKMLSKSGVQLDLHSATEVGGMPEVDETGDTFEENALLKALGLIEQIPSGSWVLADDSGLVVDALGGEPGIHSARFAGPASNAPANNLKLLHELYGVPAEKRTARFRCVLVFMHKDGETHVFEGTCEGSILAHPRGEEGFGYDPLFQPEGLDKSFAELPGKEKNELSHRGRAVRNWTEFIADKQG